MADLTFAGVLLIGSIMTVGLLLISYWWSGVMARRGWSWQVRKAKKPKSVNSSKPGKNQS